MPENTTLGPDMCLRIKCQICEKRRLCKPPYPSIIWWLCTECRERHALDQEECRWPQYCTCIPCLEPETGSELNAGYTRGDTATLTGEGHS